MRYTSNVGRLWSTPVCCFYETFMKIDLTWEYSKSETFVSGGGEAFGSRWCPCTFGCRKGALCRWVVIGLPGPFRQCQIARDGCEMEEIPLLEMLLRLSKKLRSFRSSGCGRGLQPRSVLGRQHSLKEIHFPFNNLSNSLSVRLKFLFI